MFLSTFKFALTTNEASRANLNVEKRTSKPPPFLNRVYATLVQLQLYMTLYIPYPSLTGIEVLYIFTFLK